MPPPQIDTGRQYFVEYYPLAYIRDGGPAEFNFSNYGDLSTSHLLVKLKITKSDETLLPDK